MSLGSWCSEEGQCPGPQNAQAGTFMHELGHTLNLLHGGGDNINNKPNYLSVMNYNFQISGLMGTRRWDYSRFGPDKVFDLWEGGLSEPNGFGPLDTDEAGAYKTLITCPPLSLVPSPTRMVRRNIDFNCNGSNGEGNVVTDLNGAGGDNQILRPFDDWPSVKLQGGAIGGAGLEVLLPDDTEADEATRAELTATQTAFLVPPKVDAGAVTAITSSTAMLNGSYDTPAAGKVSFRYGPDGDTLDKQTDPQTVATGTGAFSAALSELEAGRTYRARPVITTDDYETVGADMVFTAGTATTVDPPAPRPGPTIPGVGVIPKPTAASSNVCVKPTTKSKWRACYKERQKARCARLATKNGKRTSCRTRLIARVCSSAAKATRGPKQARAKLRDRCISDLRKIAKIKPR